MWSKRECKHTSLIYPHLFYTMIFLLREKIMYVLIPLYLWSQCGERWQLSV